MDGSPDDEEGRADGVEERDDDTDELIWLKWRVEEDGGLQIVETRERDGDVVRERRDAESMDEAARRYGEEFRDLAEKVLESGSRQGRYRP